jgi:hypothetical protein
MSSTWDPKSIVYQQYLSIRHSLKPKQEEFFKAFCWLVSDERRTGRSHLLSLAFLHLALSKPGESVPIWDHYMERKRHGVNTIKDILVGMLPKSGVSLGKDFIKVDSFVPNYDRRYIETHNLDNSENSLMTLRKYVIQAVQAHSIEDIKRTVDEGIVAATLEE